MVEKEKERRRWRNGTNHKAWPYWEISSAFSLGLCRLCSLMDCRPVVGLITKNGLWVCSPSREFECNGNGFHIFYS